MALRSRTRRLLSTAAWRSQRYAGCSGCAWGQPACDGGGVVIGSSGNGVGVDAAPSQQPRSYSYIPEPDDDTPLYSRQLKGVQRVTLEQMDSLARRPTLPRLVDSAAFLTSQLPARLAKHVESLEALLPPAHGGGGGGGGLAELLQESARAKRSVLEVAQDWPLLDTKSLKVRQSFELFGVVAPWLRAPLDFFRQKHAKNTHAKTHAQKTSKTHAGPRPL